MCIMASQFTSNSIICPTPYDYEQRKQKLHITNGQLIPLTKGQYFQKRSPAITSSWTAVAQ